MTTILFNQKKRFCVSKSFAMLFTGLLLSLPIATTAHTALSATTANTIQGTKPYFELSDGTALTNLNQLAGFSMWDGTYESDGMTKHLVQVDASMAGTAITAPTGLTFNDVHALVSATGTSQSVAGVTVGDDDGDAAGGAGTATGTVKVEWKNDGTTIPVGSQNQTLSVCGGPYTLEITVDTLVSANTMYGAPRTNVYGTNPKVIYTFVPQGQKICYIKPFSMQVFSGSGVAIATSSKFPYQNESNPGGYNPLNWEYESATDIHKGFSVSLMNFAGVKFPTTGFEKAVFSLIGSGGNQSKYRCTSTDNGGKISLSGAASKTLGANCTVSYNSATKAAFIAGGTPTINMQYNTTGSTWVTIDSYTIPTPTKWAIIKGSKRYSNMNTLLTSTSFPALDACRIIVDGNSSPATTNAQANDMTAAGKAWRQKYLYRRDELTNSPLANTVENSSPAIVTNYFSRDVDGTFMGEWGYVFDYTGSGWEVFSNYWTAEAWSIDYQFYVGSDGFIVFGYPDYTAFLAVCRG